MQISKNQNYHSLVKESLICPQCNMLMNKNAKFCSECGNALVEKPKDEHATSAIFIKTKMCAFHLRGKCTRGESCKFAHSNTDMAPIPDLYRTSLCSSILMSGVCENGDSCRYAHTRQELRRIRTNGSKHRPIQEQPKPEERLSLVAQPVARPQVSNVSLRELASQISHMMMAQANQVLEGLEPDRSVSAPVAETGASAEDVSIPEMMRGRKDVADLLKDATAGNSMTHSTLGDFSFEDVPSWSRQISKSSSSACSNITPVNEEVDVAVDARGSQQDISTHELISKDFSEERIDRGCDWLRDMSEIYQVRISVKNSFLAFEQNGFGKLSGTASCRSRSAP